MIHEYDIRMMKFAREVSKLSDFKQTSIGAVITYKRKEILSVGFNSNKTNPIQKKFNTYRNFRNPECAIHKLHAECDALSKLPWFVYENGFDMRNSCIYIYREHKKTHDLALSLPCPACMEAIKSNHVGRIVYCIENGIAEMKML